jgi:hypothetical protein
MARSSIHFGFSEEEAERRINEFLFMSFPQPKFSRLPIA